MITILYLAIGKDRQIKLYWSWWSQHPAFIACHMDADKPDHMILHHGKTLCAFCLLLSKSKQPKWRELPCNVWMGRKLLCQQCLCLFTLHYAYLHYQLQQLQRPQYNAFVMFIGWQVFSNINHNINKQGAGRQDNLSRACAVSWDTPWCRSRRRNLHYIWEIYLYIISK